MTDRPTHPRRWRLAAAACALALAALAALAARRGGAPASWWEPVAARRGALVETLHQFGELAPADPVLVKARFGGRLQFVIADGSWVDAGAEVIAIGDDDAVKEAAEARSQLFASRQELRLARLRRRHAEEAEALKLAQAERAARLERLRHRILTATPVGGDELLAIDAALTPLEGETEAVRAQWERAQALFQRAQDAYLDALDARSAQRDAVLRLETRAEELRASAERAIDGLGAIELAEREKAAQELPGARAALETERARGTGLESALRAARAARDAARPPRDAAATALAAREAAEEELRVRLEIEKRGLPLTKLRLEEESARLAAEEAERKLARGTASAEAGALSQAGLADLADEARRARTQLDIVRARVAIAERPLTPEQRAELDAKLARAEAKAAAAKEDRDRALALADQEIAVLEARVQRQAFAVGKHGNSFAEILESNLEFLEQELAGLDPDEPDDAARRSEAEAEREQMRGQLAKAKAEPPNVLRAPVAGVARVKKAGDRLRQPGDQVWEEDVLVEIYPPGRMEVVLRVNEVDARKLAVGQAAVVTVPALPGYQADGAITTVAQLGRDKFADDGQVAGVVQFPARVRLAAADPGLRQGMTALVAVELGRAPDALWLPLAAVRREGDVWTVMAGDAGAPAPRTVEGAPFGDDAFIVASGVAEGETVYVRREGNR